MFMASIDISYIWSRSPIPFHGTREFPIPYTSLIIQYMPNDLTFPFITSGFFWHIDSLHFDANFTLSGDRNNCKYKALLYISNWAHSF